MAGDEASPRAEEPADVSAGFEFAFDNEAFSDKVLRIEVVGDTPGSDTAASRKRRRQDAQVDDGEGIDSSSTVMDTPILQVNTIKVNSAILAAKSPFFFKLFSNGMKESVQRQSTLRISYSEENALMELLRFMYSGKLTATTESTLLVDILMVADKFEVISCMKLCMQRLIGLPMTPESAVLCLDLPITIVVPTALTEAAKKFIAERYKQFPSIEFQDELMRVPLPGIVAILSSNHLGIESQETIYDFVLKWADSYYPNSEERHKILSSRLLPLVRQECSRTNAIQLDHPSCVVDFTLKREQLIRSGSMHLPPFPCAGHGFFISVQNTGGGLVLLIEKQKYNGLVREEIDYKIEYKTIPSQEFLTEYMHTATTDSREKVGCTITLIKLYMNTSWFFDGELHLRVSVKMKPRPQ